MQTPPGLVALHASWSWRATSEARTRLPYSTWQYPLLPVVSQFSCAFLVVIKKAPKLRSAKHGPEAFRVWDRSRTVYAYGAFSSQVLSPLDELAAPKLWKLPRDIQTPLRAQFYNLLGRYSWEEKYAAQKWLGDSTQQLIDATLHKAYDSEVIRDEAKTCAEICARISTDAGIESFCRDHSVDPPSGARTSLVGRLRRIKTVPWWNRRLFKRYTRRAENGLRGAGFVRRDAAPYCSDVACRARSHREAVFDQWLDRTIVRSDAGDCASLRVIRDASVANPENRRRELMTRLRGMDELAEAAKLEADFYTLTLPSKYHATRSDGKPNPKYNGATVRDGQQELRRLWALARARLAKRDIGFCGVRVAEPHHDATPHWHMVLYSLASHREQLRAVLRDLWLSEDADEPGAQQHRIGIIGVDRNRGTVAGYLAKYIAKNIDGHAVGVDTEIDPAAPVDGPDEGPARATESAKRALTWAWLHGIRQFQFFGTARVGLWRELRRIREPIPDRGAWRIERARAAADSGEWSRFVNAVGGISVGPRTLVQVWKRVTGELSQYDEMKPPEVVGLESPEGYFRTRYKIWRLERLLSGSALGPVSLTVTGGLSLSDPRGWANPNETSMYGPN
jgi:Bacteriophage replication gene A protein (GPA)